MNIFRFIADSLHLLSFIILISKIRNTRNCLGTPSPHLSPRAVLQNTRNLSHRLPGQVLGPVPLLHLHLQHHHEDPLHPVHPLHHLHDEIQKTLLSSTPLYLIHPTSPTTRSPTHSHTTTSTSLQPSSQDSFTPTSSYSKSAGPSPSGWSPSPSSPNSTCSKKSKKYTFIFKNFLG